jgi:ppGpp synthetase/RelA/SpoT-type nucleotidyltranferase
MEWAKPEFPRNQVDRAGAAIIRPLKPDTFDEYISAVQVINNWRSAHSYPLNCFQTNLRQRARKIDANALVSQRLKRFESIVRKLERDQTSTMELSQMQDIGGCRAVLSTTAEVYRLAKAYQKGPTKKWLHTLVGVGKDYLMNPKADGYRGIHLIFRYVGTSPNHGWDKLRIEMQLRSQHQHAWATALESVDIFTNQALKANRGSQNWQRFFALMGSAIAAREGLPRVPGTPESNVELQDELRQLEAELNAANVLQYFRHAIRETQSADNAKMDYYLLHLSFNERNISWRPFAWHESQTANAQYTELEQKVSGKAGEHVVLVKAGSLAAMKRSYPSFFLDAELFLRLVADALAPRGLEPRGAGA